MAEAVEEVDFTKLPIDERCQHKNWKARVSGYEALTTLFQRLCDESSPEFNKYAGILRKFPVDSNAAAQEKGLQAVFAFVEGASPAISGRVAAEIISGIISKCLISPKAKTKELANDIIKMYIEVEKHEVVMEELLKGLDNKTPKIVAACITIIRESVRDFGPKVIKPSPLIKYVPKGLEDRDKSVRDETKLLAIELFRWMNAAFKCQLTGLKPVLMTELEAEFEKLNGEKATPTRFLRSEQQRTVSYEGATAAVGEEADGSGEVGPAPDDVDPFELVEPVEILSKLPSDFYSNCESKKWQERKQALDFLQELLTPNPKLADGDYGELVKVLKKFIQKDTMIPVVAAAAKCLADLATRLRKNFTPFAHSCVSVILEKLKEKKQNVVAALREAIDAVMLSFPLENIQEDISASLDNKNPQIKAETAAFLTRQFSSMHFSILLNKKLLKALIDPLIKTLNDMDGSVRDASAEAIGTAMKVVGEKVMNALVADVDAIKLAKIKEFHDKATVKYPAPPGGHAVPKSAGSSAPNAVTRPAKPPSDATTNGAKPKTTTTSRPKSSATIVNKPLSTKGIKSKTDCGRTGAKSASGPSRPTTAPLSKTCLSSTEDILEEPPAPQQQPTKTLNRPKSIIPPKSTAPNTSNIKSRIDCGLKKSAVSTSSLEKAPSQKSKIATPKRQSIQGSLPLSVTRSASPLEEDHREARSTDDYSEEDDYHQARMQPPNRLASATKQLPARVISTPRTESKTRPSVSRYSSSGDLPSPSMESLSPEVKLNMTMSQLSQINPRVVSGALRDLSALFNRHEVAEQMLHTRIDQLILTSVMQYRICLSKKLEPSNDPVQRLERIDVLTVFRGVTSLLDDIFKHDGLKKRASKESLGQLMPIILNIIIDTKLDSISEGKEIIRSVNILATNIVVHSDPTSLLSVLISMLIDCLTNCNTQEKFTELVFKCLWKMARMIDTIIDELDLDHFLLDVHEFFDKFPAPYWKEEGRKDTPQRTIKTITFLVVQKVGEQILNHLSLIPNPDETEVVRYLHRILRDLQRKGQIPKTKNNGSALDRTVEGVRPVDVALENDIKRTPATPPKSLHYDREGRNDGNEKVRSFQETTPLSKRNGATPCNTPSGNSAIPKCIPRISSVDSKEEIIHWVGRSADFMQKENCSFIPSADRVMQQVREKVAISRFAGNEEENYQLARNYQEEAEKQLYDMKKRFNINAN